MPTFELGNPEDDEKDLKDPPEDEESDEESSDDESTDEENLEEDSETDEEAAEDEEDSEEEPEEDPKEAKAISKMQSKINKLYGQKKELEERLNEIAEENEDLRDALNIQQEKLEREFKDLQKRFPEYTYNGRSIYELNEKEFRRCIREVTASGRASDKEIDSIEESYEQYHDQIKTVHKKASKLTEEAATLWANEWKAVEQELLKEVPELASFTDRLNERLAKDFKDELVLERLQRGPRYKMRHVLKVIQEMGIDKELEALAFRKSRPKVEAPTGVGKKRKVTTAQKTRWTRAQIEKMTTEEYRKNKESILEAAKRGDIL